MRLRVVHMCGHAHCFTFRGDEDEAKLYVEKCKREACASCQEKEKEKKTPKNETTKAEKTTRGNERVMRSGAYKSFSLTVSKEVAERLDDAAERLGCTRSKLIESAIMEALDGPGALRDLFARYDPVIDVVRAVKSRF